MFQGTVQYNRYIKLFITLLRSNKEYLKSMGIEPGDLGAHSCRKGVGTTVAAGYTVYSSIVLIYFRAGWSMGGVKDKYLKTENVGNHYVFRCASCLDQLYKKNQHHLPTWLKDEILQYESIPACTSILIDYLFAPIWYHF